jgi:hypothetical protein
VFGVVNERSRRDVNDQILAAEAGHFFAHSGMAARGLPMMTAGEIEEGILVGIGDENNVTAITAIAAVGATLGDVFFPSEGDAAVAAVAGFDLDDGFIDEHVERLPFRTFFAIKRREWEDL